MYTLLLTLVLTTPIAQSSINYTLLSTKSERFYNSHKEAAMIRCQNLGNTFIDTYSTPNVTADYFCTLTSKE